MSTADGVTLLRARGFAVCKPDRAEKRPTYGGWPTRSLEPGDFGADDSVGVIAGPLSDGGKPGHALVVIDLDAPDAVRLADEYLPETGMIDGRPGKPRSHRYYLVPVSTIPLWAESAAEQSSRAARERTGHPGPFKKAFDLPDGTRAIDFLGTGGQAVCPPATWVSEDGTRTERREWEGGAPGEPACVPFLELWAAVCDLASACGAEVPDVMPRPARPPKPQSGPRAAGVADRAGKYLAKCPGAVSGANGHKALMWAARVLVYGFDLEPDDALAMLRDLYNPRCVPPWNERELLHKVQDADRIPFSYPRGWLRDAEREQTGPAASAGKKSKGTRADDAQPASVGDGLFSDTDVANGRRFAAEHGVGVRYAADMAVWFVYDGKRWAVDRGETRVERLAKETTDEMAREAAGRVAEIARAVAETDDDEEQGRLKARMKRALAALAWAKASQDMRAVRRMLQAARSEPAVCVAKGADVFDARNDLLNCPNGTVELRTGTLREHRRGDFLTRLCPTPFDPAAPRDLYVGFLDTVFDGKPAVAEYVRDLSGCVLTGEVTDQTLNVFNGDGANGKSVLVGVWTAVLGEGEYAHTAPAQLLVGDGWDRHPTEKTGLRGARLVVCSETGEDGTLDETKMKALTGGDTITARYMRGDFFQFQPTHKLILLTNNRPRVKGTDHGVWRRIRLVPFAVRFWKDADRDADPDGDYPERFRADPTLAKQLEACAAGVLADMVERAASFYRAGGILNPPSEVTVATSEYRKDHDTIGQFFEACVRSDDHGQVKASDLYGAFKTWWEGEGHDVKRAPGKRKFGMAASRKFNKGKSSSTVYAVRLLPEPGREDGTMGGKSPIDAPAGACDTVLTCTSTPIVPSSRHQPDPHEQAERAAIDAGDDAGDEAALFDDSFRFPPD